MAKGTRRNAKQVADAIRKAGGVKTVAARMLGVSRPTLDRYIARWNDVAEAYEEANEVNLDFAEHTLIDFVRGKDAIDTRTQLDALKFYLRTKGRARGYGDRLSLDFDPTKLSDEELEAIASGKTK